MAGSEADQLLSSCERSAVHLEMRDGYRRSDPMFIAWQQGHRYDPADWDSWWRPWLDIVVAARSRGIIIRRARIVSEPVSEYIRFEYDITFTNVEAGEESGGCPGAAHRISCCPVTTSGCSTTDWCCGTTSQARARSPRKAGRLPRTRPWSRCARRHSSRYGSGRYRTETTGLPDPAPV